MAHFTQQQIREIAKQLSAIGAKDSQFKEAKSIDKPISFSGLQEGKNVLLTPDKFADYTAKNIDISKIPANIISGVTNLKDLLSKLYQLASTVFIENGDQLLATAVQYSGTIDNTVVYNVQDAIDSIVHYLNNFDINKYITFVTEDQIQSIVGNS